MFYFVQVLLKGVKYSVIFHACDFLPKKGNFVLFLYFQLIVDGFQIFKKKISCSCKLGVSLTTTVVCSFIATGIKAFKEMHRGTKAYV